MAKTAFARAGTLFIYLSGCMELLPALLFFFIFPHVISVAPVDAFFMMALGFGLTSCFVPYIFALQHDNAGNAVPIYQTVPVFVFLLGLLFLGESATAIQIFAGLLIIFSSVLVGYDFQTKTINRKAVLLMLISSFAISVFAICAKVYIVAYDWQTMSFWAWAGSSLFSLVLVMALPVWRQKTREIAGQTGIRIFILFLFQVAFQTSAIAVWYKAVSIGPSVALVQTVGGLQPAFVLLLAMIAGHFALQGFPKISIDKNLYFKFTMVAVMIFGVYLLSL